MARDEERRQIDGAFGLRRRPAFVVVGQWIARAIGAHREGAGGNFDEIRGLGRGAWGLGLNELATQARIEITPSPKSQAPSPPPSIRCSLARKRPAVPAGPLIQLRLGISSRFGPPSRSSNRRSSGRGLVRLIVEASSRFTQPGLEAALARAREIGDGAFRIAFDDPSFQMMAAKLVARPSRRCRRNTSASMRNNRSHALGLLSAHACSQNGSESPLCMPSAAPVVDHEGEEGHPHRHVREVAATERTVEREAVQQIARADRVSRRDRSPARRGSAAARTTTCRKRSASPARRAAHTARTRRRRSQHAEDRRGRAACAARWTDR